MTTAACWARRPVAAILFAAGALALCPVAAQPPGAAKAPAPAASVDFSRDVRPIFASRCAGCHGESKQRGGLRLDTAAGITTGGESGAVVPPGNAAESPLIRHVTGTGGAARMPPQGEPLTPGQIETLRRWVEQKAPLPADAPAKTARPATPVPGWAFRPVVRPPVPAVPAGSEGWARNPIDAFVLAKLAANGLRPSPEAERRVLARRVSLTLTGLPPTAEELHAFLDDPAADAYERFVDRLLASPRYGERWARHWLDVAHYADSHGQDQDRFRPNAWPYRDYLIRSFNADVPYARFVREQVAGDVLFPGRPDAVVATGFLAAGPWDESGLRDINENSLDRQVARYLDRDDIVTSTMTTFAGLTVHCARCHDHKFDPITQEDYYALQAVFAGIDKAERGYDADPAVAAKRASLSAELDRVRALKGSPDPALLTPERLAEAAAFETTWQKSDGRWLVPAPEAVRSKQGATLTALPDRSVLSAGTTPERDTYTVAVTVPDGGLTALRLEVLCDDSLPHKGPGRCSNGNLHLSEVRVRVHPKGEPGRAEAVKLKAAIADFDQDGWGVGRAIDGNAATAWGIYPEVGRPHRAVFEFEKPVGFSGGTTVAVELDQLHGGGHLIGRFRLALTAAAPGADAVRPLPAPVAAVLAVPAATRTEAQAAELSRFVWERRLTGELAVLPAQTRVYCGTNRFAPDGSFRPTPAPRPVHILKRGEVTQPGAVARPGAVEAVTVLPGRFALPDQEGPRRAALADWLAADRNPLTWRVIVNRVWHYHFGKGLVDTPNDFGAMGGAPSHPELLDWLAAEFQAGGGSLKALHRLILTSRTYRQAVRHDPAAAGKDADNRLLWRMNRGRLDAETVRDSVLLVSGRLDLTMYGPPVPHFLSRPGIHVTPEADYDRFDVDAPAARRRSIYRFIFRTRPDPLLEALDCPDASQSAPARTASVGAPQALVLWNNKFMLRHAEHLADVARAAAPDVSGQIRVLGTRVLGRPPTAAEESAWGDYARRHGAANLARVLLNSSEFLFVD
ncbi:MAG TPA: PSD1 and planctomycete cytochrome C domain-containing protein [Urbifossiella sp.]|jgi:mono/diheme cytochrome c family protein|nr:PSD1 and planctomycete cytochrome C domain-containing protein [Urbifossiella sp.]